MTPKPYVIVEAIPADYWFLSDGPALPEGTVVYEYTGHTYGSVREPNIAVSLEPGKTPFYGVPRDRVEELTHLPQLDDNGQPTDYALCDIDGGLIATNSGRANCPRCRGWWDNHDPDDEKADNR
jgi:hypothetical protein